MSDKEWRVKGLTPELQALMDDAVDCVVKHHKTCTPSETLAILCNVAGRVVAMLSPGEYTSEQISEFIQRNLEHGNKHMQEAAEVDNPLHNLEPKGSC